MQAPSSILPEQFAKLRAKTAPQLIAERAHSDRAVLAFRSKRRGLYRERTWLDYANLVGQCAIALGNLGVERGCRVAIMGDACEQWMICDQAAQALGAITFGIYPTASVSEVEYQMRDSEAAFFIAEDQEYVDKVLTIADRMSNLRSIVVIDSSAMFGYSDRQIVRLDDMLRAAGPLERGLPALEELVARLSPTDPAFIVYTSGTTGNPKGALISHGKHLAGAYTIVDLYPTLADKQHRTVIFLPLCHMFGRDVAITLPLMSRLVPHYGEHVDDLPRTLFEVAPTALFIVPRYMQKFASQLLIGLGNTSILKRKVSDLAMRAARGAARRRWSGSRRVMDPLIEALTRICVFSPMLSKIGLDKCELAISGGAPLPTETAAIWQIWGVNLVEAYGQTETGGAFISGQPGQFPRPGNVGVVARGWEAKLGDGGELLVRGPDAFEGYWRNPDATAEVMDSEGFMHTGDVAEWQDGSLRLIDRARDFVVTAGGKTISPGTIENILRGSAYITEAMVIGHARKYLTALIEIDLDAVADWARTNDIPYTGFASLASHPGVERLIHGEIAKANNELARVEQVKRFRILPKQLDPEEEGEPVTPTRKVKRALMQSRFKTLIDEMYEDREERLVAAAAGDALTVS
jgi:long-chain acyl-CoA synthetase